MSAPPKCPRCQASITTAPDEAGFYLCAHCGARLRSKTTAVVKIQTTEPRTPPPDPPPADVDTVLARVEASKSGSATLPPGTPLKKIPRPEERPAAGAVASSLPVLEALLEEIQAVRRLQEETLSLLRTHQPSQHRVPVTPLDDPFSGFEGADDAEAPPAPPPAPVRSRKRKTVLVIDDDPDSRSAVVSALEHVDVPVKTAVDGNSGLAAIAIEKPDVIVLELGLRGSMAGKDVINMIKATMEWVDIPIVLYTRQPIANQKEARIEHGADDFIPKGPNSPPVLVNKVIALFRRA